MTIGFTEKSIERAQWTVNATTVLYQQASAIARICADASEDTIIMAGVEQDLSFSGIWSTPRTQLYEHVLRLESYDEIWLLIFDPHTTLEEIQQRCTNIAQMAGKRGDIIRHRLGL